MSDCRKLLVLHGSLSWLAAAGVEQTLNPTRAMGQGHSSSLEEGPRSSKLTLAAAQLLLTILVIRIFLLRQPNFTEAFAANLPALDAGALMAEQGSDDQQARRHDSADEGNLTSSWRISWHALAFLTYESILLYALPRLPYCLLRTEEAEEESTEDGISAEASQRRDENIRAMVGDR